MYENLQKITIGGKELPIKCNIGVLAYIQEKYGTVSKFEQMLIGMTPITNESGETEYSWTEPSIPAIKDITPLFIREGIIQAELQGEDYSDIEWKDAFDDFDFNYIEVALALHFEFQRCFHRKKKTNLKATTKKQTTKK